MQKNSNSGDQWVNVTQYKNVHFTNRECEVDLNIRWVVKVNYF